MRIVAGRLKGRPLAAPSSDAIRPTSDRLRGAIFNVLAHAYGDVVPDARVLDLYAGTGALGLEAMSRGAAHATFVETGDEARALIRRNVEALGLAGATRIVRRDATRLGPAAPSPPCSLAFCDPPYRRDLVGPTLASLAEGGWLVPGALVVVERESGPALACPAGFAELERRLYGETEVAILAFGAGR